MTPDPAAEPPEDRLDELSARAGRAGYRLECGRWSADEWHLLDADDGELIYEARTLDEVAHWLGS